MKKTEFFSPNTIKDTLEILDQYRENAVIVNGGTDIVEKISNGKVDPKAIVYIQNIEALKKIRQEKDYIGIGGAVTYKEILESPVCQKFWGFIEAVEQIGSPPIRSVATLAGNIGTAAPAADGVVMLLALEAEIVLASQQGIRNVPLKDIFAEQHQVVVEKNELIQEIRIPISKANLYSAYTRITRRKAQDIGKVLIGVSLEIEDQICKDIRIALGALSPTPQRAYSLEERIKGEDVLKMLPEIKGIFPKEAKPRASRFKSYKEQVTGIMIERAVKKAYARALGGERNG